MKLNNKGMTLIELLISIVLVGIVLTFLFQLLSDLQNESENNNYAHNNQLNKADVIYTLQRDLQQHTLVGIKNVSANNKIAIEFHFVGEKGNIITTLKTDYKEFINDFNDNEKTYYLRYTDYNRENYSWEMKGATVDNCVNFTYYVDNISNKYYLKLNIPIYNKIYHDRNNKDKNNAVDDIEITFSGSKNDLDINNSSFLTGTNKIEQQICA